MSVKLLTTRVINSTGVYPSEGYWELKQAPFLPHRTALAQANGANGCLFNGDFEFSPDGENDWAAGQAFGIFADGNTGWLELEMLDRFMRFNCDSYTGTQIGAISLISWLD